MTPLTEPAGFTKADLELAAGARSYERGLDYLHAVADLEVTGSDRIFRAPDIWYTIQLTETEGDCGGSAT
ncbi:MAG TPA: hypothetical protein VFQ44_30920 [Streptosporangiaceae bacterium]|nr:hypothetical protein [Streptosporangiaceae bacterium]